MLDRAFHLIRTSRHAPSVHWISADIGISGAEASGDWSDVYHAGVRAVVEVCNESDSQGGDVRRHGMRYLGVCLQKNDVPSAEELQIVASWVLDRTADNGRVLIQDGHSRLNDGLVAVASLVKGGLPVHLALLALKRAIPGMSLDYEQNRQLLRFSAALHVV
jgi:hypothetical protein